MKLVRYESYLLQHFYVSKFQSSYVKYIIVDQNQILSSHLHANFNYR